LDPKRLVPNKPYKPFTLEHHIAPGFSKRAFRIIQPLRRYALAMFKIMYETEGVGLAAPQVGVNYRLMVYNEAGEAGEGKEVVLVNPTITKFSKSKDLFEEGCLSFPKIYADVEVRLST
jgi:peptide deformylase